MFAVRVQQPPPAYEARSLIYLTMRSHLLSHVQVRYAMARGQWSSRLSPTSLRTITSQQRNPAARAFDITTTNEVAREVRGGGGGGGDRRGRKYDAAAWHLSGAFTRFDRRVSFPLL